MACCDSSLSLEFFNIICEFNTQVHSAFVVERCKITKDMQGPNVQLNQISKELEVYKAAIYDTKGSEWKALPPALYKRINIFRGNDAKAFCSALIFDFDIT